MNIIWILLMQSGWMDDANGVNPDFWNRASDKGLQFRISGPIDLNLNQLESEPYTPSFGRLLWHDTKEVFTTPFHWSSDNWREMGYLIASFAVVNQFDDEVAHYARDHNNSALNTTARELGKFGEEYSFATLAGFYLVGKVFGEEKPVNVAKDGLIASLLSAGIVTPLIKEATGRTRPRDTINEIDSGTNFEPFSGNHSFPSGHTTQAFAVASVISEHYPNVWARSVSYGLASLVGLSRVQGDAHYASDVAAGAAIGLLMGRRVVRINQGKRDRVAIDPVVDNEFLGIRIRVPQGRKGIRAILGRDS